VTSGLPFSFSDASNICFGFAAMAFDVSQIEVLTSVISTEGHWNNVFHFPILPSVDFIATDMADAFAVIEQLHPFFFTD
jgi:hypothetical protein